MAGHAEYRSRHPMLLSSHLAVDILIDVLTDRGFNVAHFVEERIVPRRVDMKTGLIQSMTEDVHSFRITFNKENIRDLTVAGSMSNHSSANDNPAIGKTYVPEHLKRGNDVDSLFASPGHATNSARTSLESGSARPSLKQQQDQEEDMYREKMKRDDENTNSSIDGDSSKKKSNRIQESYEGMNERED